MCPGANEGDSDSEKKQARKQANKQKHELESKKNLIPLSKQKNDKKNDSE